MHPCCARTPDVRTLTGVPLAAAHSRHTVLYSSGTRGSTRRDCRTSNPVIKQPNHFQHRPIWWFGLSITPQILANSSSSLHTYSYSCTDRAVTDDIPHTHINHPLLPASHRSNRPSYKQPWLISCCPHPCFDAPPPVAPCCRPRRHIHRKSPPPNSQLRLCPNDVVPPSVKPPHMN